MQHPPLVPGIQHLADSYLTLPGKCCDDPFPGEEPARIWIQEVWFQIHAPTIPWHCLFGRASTAPRVPRGHQTLKGRMVRPGDLECHAKDFGLDKRQQQRVLIIWLDVLWFVVFHCCKIYWAKRRRRRRQ